RAEAAQELGQGAGRRRSGEDESQRHVLRDRGGAVGATAPAPALSPHRDRPRERRRYSDRQRTGSLMDPRLLQYYGQELSYIRELGAEFARDFPKIAGRLGLET